MLEIPFTSRSNEAAYPEKAHAGDAGHDLSAIEEVTVAPGEWEVLSTGIAVAIPRGYAGLVLPRSGLAVKYGITLLNSPGLIDSGYRGEVHVPLINHGHSSFTVEKGMRVAQILVVRTADIGFAFAESLSESEDGRGDGGFGSSG